MIMVVDGLVGFVIELLIAMTVVVGAIVGIVGSVWCITV